MKDILPKLFFLFLVLTFSLSNAKKERNCTINDLTIIGIVTLPSDPSFGPNYPSSSYSYLKSPYVKYIQGAGARVSPIPYDAPEDYLEFLIENVNGLVLTGGNTDLWDLVDGVRVPSPWFKKVQFILSKALELNLKGDHFPIWGTQQGMNAILLALSGDMNILDQLQVKPENYKLNFLPETASSKLYSLLTKDLWNYSESSNIFWTETKYGLTNHKFWRSNLPALLKPLTTSIDNFGMEYITSMESKEYPIYLVEFNPEINIYDWSNKDFCHNFLSIKIAQRLAFQYVNESRTNFHEFPNSTIENSTLIYNYNVTNIPQTRTPIFFFPKSDQKVTVE
jgi:gamma-glutamyl hydrolase